MMTLVLSALATLTIQIVLAHASIDIGVNYGREGTNLPSAAEVVQLYKNYSIGKMRLFEPDASILQALRGSQIALTLGLRNEDLPILAANVEAVNSWFATNVEPYLNDINFSCIVVGRQIIPGDHAKFVLPVMQYLQNILIAKHLIGIKVSTSVSASILGNSYPPSQGAFSEASKQTMIGILSFLSSYGSPLLVNLYPYFAYASEPQHIRLDYAQFTATGPVVHDGNLSYWNLFDTMVDAFFSAMEGLGNNDVGIVVSETGWPSDGNGNLTTPSLAATYNQNFVKHIVSRAGTPKRPGSYIEGYIFAMFNENLKSAGVGQHFGLFYPNMQPVYCVFPPVAKH
ncbi:hypothetical protein L6164_013890 [Bauhinia variegata]|uniref:Uncharacterized protein n=1 Tax=Bauhinia variegata TaxID=167791 RepID=A0ACB9NGT3_BAUVA|nr:hypothetical protein L6164_013890 [Bauhinia variegata]